MDGIEYFVPATHPTQTPYPFPPLRMIYVRLPFVPTPAFDFAAYERDIILEYKVQAYKRVWPGDQYTPRLAFNWIEGHHIASWRGFCDVSSRARGRLRAVLDPARAERLIEDVGMLAWRAAIRARGPGPRRIPPAPPIPILNLPPDEDAGPVFEVILP